MYDRITTRSRGFGFITFEDPQICQRLIHMKRIQMRSDKFVEIKEAQPRETMTHPNLPYTLHNTYGRGGEVSAAASNASFVSGMNQMMIGEPSMMDQSYMSLTYGHASADMSPPSPSVARGFVDFTPYPTTDTLTGSPQFYSSNVHYSNNTLFVPETTTASFDEGQTNNMFLRPPPMSPSFVLVPYGEPFVPNYGMDNSYVASTLPNGTTSDELSPSSRYPTSMPYYINQYIPPPPAMTNNLDIPHRMNHPYDPPGMVHMSPTRSFHVSYVPTTSLQPPNIDEAKMDRASPPQFFSAHDNIDASKRNSVAEQHQNHKSEREGTITPALSVTDKQDGNQQSSHLQETKE